MTLNLTLNLTLISDRIRNWHRIEAVVQQAMEDVLSRANSDGGHDAFHDAVEPDSAMARGRRTTFIPASPYLTTFVGNSLVTLILGWRDGRTGSS